MRIGEIDLKKVKNNHQTSFKDLMVLYFVLIIDAKFWKSIAYSLTLTFFIIISVAPVSNKALPILEYVSGVAIGVLPSLLGFLLSGFVLFVSFANQDFIKQIYIGKPSEALSQFQILIIVFAFCMIIQIITLGFFIIVQLIAKFGLSIWNWLPLNCEQANMIVLSIGVFMIVYSFWLIRDMIVNMFAFAQQYHMSVVLEKYKEIAELEKQMEEQSLLANDNLAENNSIANNFISFFRNIFR
jgi:hypothetical protein